MTVFTTLRSTLHGCRDTSGYPACSQTVGTTGPHCICGAHVTTSYGTALVSESTVNSKPVTKLTTASKARKELSKLPGNRKKMRW